MSINIGITPMLNKVVPRIIQTEKKFLFVKGPNQRAMALN
jgi:hypothetical protein